MALAESAAMVGVREKLLAWWQFTAERFPLAAHIPMVACFVAGNAFLALRVENESVHLLRLACSALVSFSFFFRLRCFDEIKDLEVDKQVNPTRPLARGLLAVAEVKQTIFWLILTELALAAMLGIAVFVTHLIAVIYSWLMYKEFYIGPKIRHRLTTYAVMHTFVSVLIGYSIATFNTGDVIFALPRDLLAVGLANWMLFNVFEFARKTFASEEERPGVATYSSLFGPWGAAALTFSQVTVALALLWFLPSIVLSPQILAVQVGLALVVGLSAAVFAVVPRPATARMFRAFATVYLLLFFVVIVADAFFR